MTGRVDILLRIFEKNAKKVKNEVTGTEKRSSTLQCKLYMYYPHSCLASCSIKIVYEVFTKVDKEHNSLPFTNVYSLYKLHSPPTCPPAPAPTTSDKGYVLGKDTPFEQIF